jgi:asparagine synthase (glutamine-hydrolysing)
MRPEDDMSAIIAIYDRQGNPAITEQGDAMMRALSRFPADDEQTWKDRPGVFLGCRAQWITPESVGERNPLHDPERGLTVVADAILDNREELCDALGIEAARRKNATDPELLLLAYDAWGTEMAERLVGDFAFAIWDDRRRRLYAARDFSGARTLYFARDPAVGTVWLCTIMKPLLSLPHLSGSLNRQWIAEFLALPYSLDSVDGQHTVYEGIWQIPPAHYLVADAEGRLETRAYCRIEEPREKLRLKSDAEYEEALRDVLGKAVKARLRTHRAVGAHLSGGLDSGTVATFAARELRSRGKSLHTFSYVPVPDFTDWTPRSRIADERPYITAVVKHAGNIVPDYCDFPDASPYSVIDEWLDVLEMPYKFYENSFWILGIFERAAERSIAVILSGQRGNWTISWGPALDYQSLLLKRLRIVRFCRELNAYAHRIGTGRKQVLRTVLRKAAGVGQESRQPLASPELLEETGVVERLKRSGLSADRRLDAYQVRMRMFRNESFWNLHGTCSTKLSLRHAVWDRDPTNDLRVVRFCLSVPEDQFVRDGIGRSLIRRVTEGHLPDNVRLNLKVRGAQGADGVHRMKAAWPMFVREAQEMVDDKRMNAFLNLESLRSSLLKVRDEPKPEYAYDHDFRSLMHGLIFRRFVRLQERR